MTDRSDDEVNAFFGGLDEFERARMQSHFFGPVDTGYQCLRCVAAADSDGAWQLFAPDLKRFVTYQWVNHPDVAGFLEAFGDGRAADLVSLVDELMVTGDAATTDRPYPTRFLWTEMMTSVMRSLRDGAASFDWVEVVNAGMLGAASATRPVPPHFELVRYIATSGEPLIIHEPTLVRALDLLLEPAGEGWLVNAFGETPSAPA
jgi:hypothetical protein